MTLVITHSTVTGAAADATALVDGPKWDANHTLTGVISPAQGGTGIVNNNSSTITVSGSFGITFTVAATTNITLPATGSLVSTTSKLSDFAATSSAELAGVISDETGTGALVFANTPTLVTPVLGVATATTVNKVTITAPASAATLTIPNGVTLTGPASSGTAMTLGNTETVTGVKTFGSAGAVGRLNLAGTTSGTTVLDASAVASGTITVPAATDTLVGKATTDTLTNKTYDTAGAGNSFSINGVAATANTGTGAVARAAGPTFTTPTLGAATATTLNGNTFTTGTYTLTGTAGKTFTFSNTLTLSGTDASTLAIGVGGTLTGSSSAAIWYDNIPQNSKSTAYTTVLSDAQKHIYHPSSDNNARTFTIDSNANVAYPIGTVITFVNEINTVTIAITSDTLTLQGAGTTGSRTLAANGMATAMKVASTKWVINGPGLT